MTLPPVPVRPRLGDCHLELFVPRDRFLLGVDEQHPSGLEPALLHNILRSSVIHSDLGGHDHQVVLGDIESRRAEAVPVQDRADIATIAEGQQCWPVPGLHGAGGPTVEVLLVIRHDRVILPCFRYHCHDGFR